MKNRIVVSIALLTIFSMTAVAQGRGMRSPEERAKRLQEQLTLTVEQTASIKKIYEDSQKGMQEMMGESMGDREAMRNAFIDMTAKQDSLIEQLLTKEQVVKYEGLKKERRQRMQQLRRGQ